MDEKNLDNQAAELLKRYEPGFLPYPVFEQIARLVALPILEIIPLRLNGEHVEVLLIERDPSDTLWPGTVHTPGTVIRATDNNHDETTAWQPLERVLHDELHDTVVGPLHYVGSMLHASKRGAEQAQLYWVEVSAEPQVGTFYPVNSLPANLIESQLDFINQAAQSFRNLKANQ